MSTEVKGEAAVAVSDGAGLQEPVNHFDLEYEFKSPVPGPLSVQKHRSRKSGMTTYFVDMDTQIINGYFCFGSDQPESVGIEQLLQHLDSSGGLLPSAMRSEMLRPAWQFHGPENPLADRDESCYVCCALGESAFLGTFSCSLYLLQNLETVLDVHGYPYVDKNLAKSMADREGMPTEEGEGPGVAGSPQSQQQQPTEEKLADVKESEEEELEPTLNAPFYCLSESGEGAMAWEATLQSMFPGVKAFWNRILNDVKCNHTGEKMRKCFDEMYRPENMTVIITGPMVHKLQILEMLSDHELEYFENHPHIPAFKKSWSFALPPPPSPVSNTVSFIARNPIKVPSSTLCIGWRGCPSTDLETSLALKSLTAYIAVGPLWTQLVTSGHAHRISWCQLEYKETCSLITIHSITDKDTVAKAVDVLNATLKELSNGNVNGNNNNGFKLGDIQAMVDRVGWHYIRETESEPFLIVAAAIAKAERYGDGSKEQVDKRICPRPIVDDLLKKPVEYWMDLLAKYFVTNGLYSTQVIPVDADLEQELRQNEYKSYQERAQSEMQFAESSRRASSKPRRSRAGNAVGQEANVALEGDGRNNNLLPQKNEEKRQEGAAAVAVQSTNGPLEEQLNLNIFPFGDNDSELAEFEERMEQTKSFLSNVKETELRYWNMKSYRTGGTEQHPLFNLNQMPFYTFLDDTQSAFVYITLGLDTSLLDKKARRLVAPVTAALGAFVCPRPPALDTDVDIKTPTEFNPPMHIGDSQVSLGLNGESTQSIFLTLIVRPEKYKWTVGLLHYILFEADFSTNYLRFISKEAARGLAANYKMQKAEEPNYECFDSGEINLHGLISLIYKEESNARLFVGRRRLDLMMDFLNELENSPESITQETNETWRKIVAGQKMILQIAGNISEIAAQESDLIAPWNRYFSTAEKQKSLSLQTTQLTSEPEVMLSQTEKGLIIELSAPRTPCLSLAIPINPNSKDFPKLCMAAQMFSMAQKWVWSCWGLDDSSSPVLRMPCSYANLITLNLEGGDVMGSFVAMKKMIKDDWPWLETLLIATKMMVINDPATLELGAQGSIMSALLSHVNGQTVESRRTLLKESMNVTLEDVKEVINKYLIKLFEPASAWCSLMIYKPEQEALIKRVEQLGFQLTSIPINELCQNL